MCLPYFLDYFAYHNKRGAIFRKSAVMFVIMLNVHKTGLSRYVNIVIISMLILGGQYAFMNPIEANSLSMLVPLYVYPIEFDVWDEVADANEYVPITAIINPHNGPGEGPPNSDYENGLETLNDAGVTVVGYVCTSYGKRDLQSIKADIDIYNNYFNIDGIFLDEVSGNLDNLDFYDEVYQYVKSLPSLDIVILNPGVRLDKSFFQRPVGDLAVIFENNSVSWRGYIPDPTFSQFSPERFGILIHAVPDIETMQEYVELARERNIGYLYLTDDGMPNPWDSLPGFWMEEVEYLNVLNRAQE